MLIFLGELLLLFSPFLLLLALVVWDRKRLEKAAGHPRASNTHEAKAAATDTGRKLFAGMAAVAAAMSILEWMSPSGPPFTGRWSWLTAWAHSHLGQGGSALIWLMASALLFAAAYFGRNR